jgi:hypothetical protein
MGDEVLEGSGRRLPEAPGAIVAPPFAPIDEQRPQVAETDPVEGPEEGEPGGTGAGDDEVVALRSHRRRLRRRRPCGDARGRPARPR